MVKEIQNERRDGDAKIKGRQGWRVTDETNTDNTNAGIVNNDAMKIGSLQ